MREFHADLGFVHRLRREDGIEWCRLLFLENGNQERKAGYENAITQLNHRMWGVPGMGGSGTNINRSLERKFQRLSKHDSRLSEQFFRKPLRLEQPAHEPNRANGS